MKKVLGVIFATLALLIVVNAVAAQMKPQKVFVPYDGSLAGTHLARGTYQVECEINGAGAKLTFIKERKTVATVEGKVVDRNQSYSNNTVVYDTKPDGSLAIVEIRFAHPNEVVVFND